MFLYNLSLQKATGCQTAVYGNFSGPKAQEIMVSRGKILELLRPDDSGKLQTVYSTEIFGVVRSLAAFRLTGAQKDYLVVGSDSGRFTVLEYSKEKNRMDVVHSETFGKSGCRRIVPGQYLAVDPKGRAAMIGACEKQKLVYVFNRDTAANLTISSPLEAHKSHTIVFAITAVDCGFDNPVFAAIELDYADADQDSSGEAASEAQKHLTFYELDLGLNHVVRKWTEPVDNGANLLLTVPGGADGPSGVLVCAENFVIYKKENHPDVRAVIPRRADLPGDRGVLIVSYATHKLKNTFFFLLQSEYGDIYKVTLEYKTQGDAEVVTELKMKYFDTIPTCAAICVLKTGFLFAGSEFGNHAMYQFAGIGDHDDDVESSSATLMETEEGFQPVFFDPRPLRNLSPIDEMPSICPLMDLQAVELPGEETATLVTACGRGPRSTVRMLKQGVSLTEMAVSPLPGHPNAVWTVKRSAADDFDSYIVVSFVNATLVLSIGDTVEEVNDSGFLGTTPSLRVGQLGEDSLMQAHPGGLRHIRADRRVNEWKTPGRKSVLKVASNHRQVVLALSGGELVYFEMEITGQLVEVDKKEMSGEISCLDVSAVPEGRQRAKFLAVGCFDNTVRILSLDPDNCLAMLATQAVAAAPESLLMLDTGIGESEQEADASMAEAATLFLNIGLQNGVLLRTEVDRVTGQLSDTRTRFLGARAPKLFSTTVRGQQAMLALSTRPWLGYLDAGRFILAPLSYELLEYASSFASEQCPEGIVAIAQSSLRIVTVERLGEAFNQTSCKLRYTPRKMCMLPAAAGADGGKSSALVVVGADHACASTAEAEAAHAAAKAAAKEAKKAIEAKAKAKAKKAGKKKAGVEAAAESAPVGVFESKTPLGLAKALKNEAELAGMREAHLRDSAAMAQFFAWLEAEVAAGRSVTEAEVGLKLIEVRGQQEGFIEESFPTIAGAGPNGAIIHYRAIAGADRSISADTMLLLDSGAQYDCGTTDVTRTMHLGEPSDHQCEAYTRVLQGNIGLDQAVFPSGLPGFMLDSFARKALWQAGLDYRHGTGHGVGAGLNVHEGPQGISPRYNNTQEMLAGMIVSNEPGYYEDGSFGIRIENLLVVSEQSTANNFGGVDFLGFNALTLIPIQAKMIKPELLAPAEVDWINAYHAKVWEAISPRVEGAALEWLRANTQPLTVAAAVAA
uniref:DNA damage-binding protein 1 n=1 Tax=Pyramimonas obovata TaxID=1411642 RepID=A0A7S0MU40_9CHLO|mmetsp:Transcript_11543/g.24165  ORF Transcript_11543/g.24165 Transcript_11543/m.24165 type:complete len:1187 (+) Transcript_11543:156-3716(+)